MDPVTHLAEHPAVAKLCDALARHARLTAFGTAGASTAVLAAAVARRMGKPVLLVVAHVDEADEIVGTLESCGVAVVSIPAMQTLPGESSVSYELMAARLAVVHQAMAWQKGEAAPGADTVMVAPIHALMQPVPSAQELAEVLLEMHVGNSQGPGPIVRWLDNAGYTRVEAVSEAGDYAVRGGIVDVFSPGDPAAGTEGRDAMSAGGVPVRLDFFGDTLEKISEVDLATMGADRTVRGVRLIAPKAAEVKKAARGGLTEPITFAHLLPPGTITVLAELIEITEQGRGYFERSSADADIVGPPAVMAALVKRSAAMLEVTGIAGLQRTADAWPLPVGPAPQLADQVGEALADLTRMVTSADGNEPADALICCQNAAQQARLHELIGEHAPMLVGSASLVSNVQYLHAGFVWQGERGYRGGRSMLFLPYHELLHRFETRKLGSTAMSAARRLRAGTAGSRAIDSFLDVEVGDYVVHTEHGIARYLGLVTMQPQQAKATLDQMMASAKVSEQERRKQAKTAASALDAEEFLTLEFEGSAKLHVPASKIDLVQKYIGGGAGRTAPPLSTLGGSRWKNQKQRVADSVKDLAAELLRIRAAREHLPGIRYPVDTPWQREFEDEFPHDDTEDQTAALSEIKRDMQSARPMDRLLCGDVGYGKTELAIRAAFKAVEFGKQVAVLVPTTVLAEQHERTFKARFADYPFNVESISRFKTDGEINAVLERAARGQVDILIGTHRLLSNDVKFADLGVVIIDEEQRFGVEHKERLLSYRMTVDVLTLSATPIPRTLHMSMLGIRDISSLATAPADRRAVVTEVIPYNAKRLEQVIARELSRDGQIYYVHNRVYNIQEVAAEVQALAPSARVVYGHGQMAPKELEAVMLKFMRRQADILVSTTIIESGIDNPTANTMIIADADRFGLSELHQLRGRVGRYKNRAYCYMLLPDDRPIKEKAKKRLAAIEQFSMLGAGFKIAMRDLEIRGAGNILGPEQSGHIAAVGYDMYCQLLERSVRQLKNEVVATPSEVSLDIGVTGLIPKGYIPSEARRLEAYRRIAVAPDAKTLDQIRADIISAYGSVPEACERLLDLALVRAGARSGGVRSILIKERDLVIRTTDQASVVGRMIGAPGRSTVLPPRNPGEVPEVYWRPEDVATLEPRRLLGILKRQFGAAAAIGSGGGGVAGAVVKPAGSTMIAPAAPLPPKGPSIKKPLFSPARIVPVNRTASGSSPAAGKKLGKVPLSRELRDVKKMLRQAAKESPQFKAVDSGGEASDDDL